MHLADDSSDEDAQNVAQNNDDNESEQYSSLQNNQK